MSRRQSRRKQGAREQATASVAALDHDTLNVLMALLHLLGSRREWPAWAMAAAGIAEPSDDDLIEYQRLCRRAWSRVDWRTRRYLGVVATALGTPVPQERKRTRQPPNRQHRQQTMRRTKPPGAAPAPRRTPKRTAGALHTDAAGDAGAQRRAQELAARANADPDTWQPAHTLSEALHEDHGWG